MKSSKFPGSESTGYGMAQIKGTCEWEFRLLLSQHHNGRPEPEDNLRALAGHREKEKETHRK